MLRWLALFLVCCTPIFLNCVLLHFGYFIDCTVRFITAVVIQRLSKTVSINLNFSKSKLSNFVIFSVWFILRCPSFYLGVCRPCAMLSFVLCYCIFVEFFNPMAWRVTVAVIGSFLTILIKINPTCFLLIWISVEIPGISWFLSKCHYSFSCLILAWFTPFSFASLLPLFPLNISLLWRGFSRLSSSIYLELSAPP